MLLRSLLRTIRSTLGRFLAIFAIIALGVIGGMIVGTLAILFTVPVFFIFFEYLQEKIRPAMKVEADQQFLKEQAHSQQERAEAEE